MVLTEATPFPTYVERFRAAWRGEESLAWVFWSFYVLIGIALGFGLVALRILLLSYTGDDLSGSLSAPIGQVYLLISNVLNLGYFVIAFILLIRCISNVSWKGWEYLAMLFLLVLPFQIAGRAQDIYGYIFA